MFDDRITVESPGILPGIVRLNNLRTVHFSRNPNIARFLHEYDYVQEFGEGVDRMFKEMAAAGLPAPEYRDNAFMLNATIRNGVINEVDGTINEVINGAINGAINISATEQAVLSAIKKNQKITKAELQKETSLGKSTIDRAIKALKEKCLIERVGSNKTGYWKIINKQL
ncbi:MAG: winged helix-turn-helix transcriptional regulator [Lachnospiraceae bacterium]|nr:winged helix-turn-helix transcriptional regulator [Lachnospiraceae bacterium]